MKYQLLQHHDSPSTAYIIPSYPYGSGLRCIKRLWIEDIAKGQNKGLQRLVEQTTTRPFNQHYTEELNKLFPETRNPTSMRVREFGNSLPQPGDKSWNKPHPSTACQMVFMYLDLSSDTPDHVQCFSLGVWSLSERFKLFREECWDQLDDKQRVRFEQLERLNGGANKC